MPVRVEPCGDARWALGMGLLPELVQSERLPARLWVATPADQPDQILGAAALITRPRDTRRTGFSGLVRVLPSWRRQGLGMRLLACLCTEAERWGVPYLHGWGPLAEGGEAAFLRRQGFEPLRQVSHFYGEAGPALAHMRPRLQRLQRRLGVAAGWQLRDLTPADQADVATLYAAHFGLSVAAATQRVAQALATPIGQACSVLVRAPSGALAAFVLAQPKDGLPEVGLWFTHPQHRQGPAALMVLTDFMERGQRLGAPGAFFHCHDETPATLKTALRVGALTTLDTWTYAKPLAAAQTVLP